MASAGYVPVSLRIEYDERAIGQAAAFLNDPHRMRQVLDAIDRLANEPRPAWAVPLWVAWPAAAAGRPVPGPV